MATLTQIAGKEKRANSKRKPATKNRKPATGNRKPATGTRSNVPYADIAEAYNKGQSMAEISDGLKLTRKDSNVPYSVVNNALWRLGKGVVVDGKTIKIVRGKRGVAKKSAAA
jgi:hypothetical protein